MSHPSLGLPPPDLTAGFPAAAARLRAASQRVGTRALEIVLTEDPTFAERHDELALRRLLRDSEIHVDRLAMSLASNDPRFVRLWAEQIIPVYRRRKVPIGDLIQLAEALRQAADAVVAPGERGPIDEATEQAVRVFHRQRRIAGDGRRRNRLLELIYKGA